MDGAQMIEIEAAARHAFPYTLRDGEAFGFLQTRGVANAEFVPKDLRVGIGVRVVAAHSAASAWNCARI